jgi:hypothetical protein
MKTSLLLILLQLAASGNDAYWTDRNMHTPHFHEDNPTSALFVHNRPSLIAYVSISAAGRIALTHVLRKHHHNRLATALAVTSIADNVYGGVTSAANSR